MQLFQVDAGTGKGCFVDAYQLCVHGHISSRYLKMASPASDMALEDKQEHLSCKHAAHFRIAYRGI